MKTAKKLLSVFLAVLMLFSVMSVGLGGIVSIAQDVTVGSQTGNDIYKTTDGVIIAVPETVYMRPGDDVSVSGQYYVNNYVNENGEVILDASRDSTAGKLSIYAPGATAFKFTATGIEGSGIGDPIFGSTVNASTTTYEGQRWENTTLNYGTGYVYFDALQLYINGAGIGHGGTALVEWKVTVYFGDSDTTGKTYYAYTTLYTPHRSVGAVAESRMEADMNNEISSWVSGVTGYGGRKSVSQDRVGDGGTTADGYLIYDPLWTSTFGVGSSEDATDYVAPHDSIRTAHSVATKGDQWSNSVGYMGYLTIDGSRYANTNQVPNFQIGADVLRIGDKPNYSLESHNVWYTLGNGNEQVEYGIQEPIPQGWDAHPVDYDGDGKEYRWSIAPSYEVSAINGKYVHIASQAHCRSTWGTTNFANAYISMQFSVTDKSDLRASVIQATSLDESKYTVASWRGASDKVIEEFHDALRVAAEVLGTPGASQGSIDSALGNLNAKKNALKVTIKFDAATNGGIFMDGESVKEYSVRFGTVNFVTLGAAMLNYFQAVMNGYELAGWTLEPDADPTTASLDAVFNVSFGDTLYAHYKKDISVNFNYLIDLKGNTEVFANTLTLYNGEDKALNVTVPDADDVGEYKFAGWTTDPASTEGVTLDSTIEGVTESSAYYATYEQILRLTLDANGGQCSVGFVEGSIGYNYNLTETAGIATVTLPEATRAGHGFKGWDIGGTIYQAGDTVELTQNETATAVWSVNNYTVTFKYKTANGTDASVKVDVEYGQPATAPEVSDYYSNQTMHYQFTGWDTAFDSIAGDTTVTAQYASGTMHNYTTTGTPNCDETVDVIYTCSVCMYSYINTVEAGHKYVVTDSKDPDCEEDGYITYTCSRDPSHTYTEVVPATGHSFENTEYIAPTCTDDGKYISGICATCGEDLAGKIIPALGHDFSIELEHKDADCDEDGYTKYGCSRCDVTKTDVHPALGHSYTAVTVPAACEKEGSVTYTCSVCDHSYVVKIPALEHHFTKMVISPTCTSQGYTATTCTLCGTSTREDYVPALGHSYKSVVVAPTCTDQGYTKHTCSVCNFSYKTDYVDAIGHDYSIETVVAPNCTDRGYTLHECANCGDTYKSDFVAATGHDYVHTATVQATATMAGYHLYECTKCDCFYKDMQYVGGKALLCVTLYDTAGKAVTSATITLTDNTTGKEIVIKTDANGYFTQVVPEGDYTVAISRNGYFCDDTGSLAVELGTADLKLPSVEKNPCDCLCHQNTFWAKIYKVLIKMFSIFGKIYCCDCCEIWD